MKWQSKEAARDLLNEFVRWESINGTVGEIEFPHRLKEKLLTLDYFKENDEHINLYDAGKERQTLTALYESDKTAKTIVLMSHFDTVDATEYGEYEDYAFDPETLTKMYEANVDDLPEHARADIRSQDYLFGRGTMDMKMGLVLHMQLLERAIVENWSINILLVAVPDEEVNSAGMRAAVTGLVDLRKRFNLSYELFLNSEPSFAQTRTDENYYIYSGTIGKIMPGALFYGRSTHAGDPLNGISSQYMMSYVTKAMEFNEAFFEESFGEKTPLPICLKSYDLKTEYTAQTSHHAAALFNVFLFEKSAEQVMETFYKIAQEALTECQDDYEAICQKENVEPFGTIKVLTYEELHTYALEKLGEETIHAIKQEIINNESFDEREMSIHICDALMLNCPELAPATVLFFAPPYYPAVNSSNNELIQEKISLTQRLLQENFNIDVKQVHYFNGICDLSYVNYDKHDTGWQAYQTNTPVWGDVYNIPFAHMQQLAAPVLNIGPFGKDAHQLTERLHKRSAFEYTPYVLCQVIKSMFD